LLRQLVGDLGARSEVHLVGRLALEGAVRHVRVVLLDVEADQEDTVS
jgi:hypothetical protein